MISSRLRSKADREIIAKLASSLIFNEYKIHRFISANWQFGKKSLYNDLKDKEKIIVYLKIENEMFNLLQRRDEKNSLVPDEYERPFLTLAIERIAGDKLTNIDDDYEFELKLEVLKVQYRRWYYRVAYKYKLPTPRILPFLWRLITP